MSLENAPLGRSTQYPDRYAPDCLFPVARRDNRLTLGLEEGVWPWFGEDLWHAYELSWLAPSRLPRVAMAEIRVPVDSPFLIESKSLKLYLNSFSQEVMPSDEALTGRITEDLSRAAGCGVRVQLQDVDQNLVLLGQPPGYQSLDGLAVQIDNETPDPELLAADEGHLVEERLYSHLLRSRCPVTGQPDWGTLLVSYRGPRFDRPGLLRYLVGYRQQQDFHEHCVEHIFVDLLRKCRPHSLCVSACYTRRGGLDINPWRSTGAGNAPALRLTRQ